jgi:AbrB family looped-hinge helix DNA binding protein
MNQVETAARKPNDMDYFFEKSSISQCEKKCLAFRGSLHFVVIPKALIDALGWKKGDELEFKLENGKVFLRKSKVTR